MTASTARPATSRRRLLAGVLTAAMALAAAGCQTAADPRLALDTVGGDAWTFDKRIGGRTPSAGCAAIVVRSPAGSARAWQEGGRFEAEVPLAEGRNPVWAECADGGRSAPQEWTLRLPDRPKAWIRTRVEDGAVLLDAGRSERAAGTPAPLRRFEWRARPGNPAPLVLADGAVLDARPVSGERLRLRAPAVDGDYYLTLSVTDARGRSDTSTAMFRVEAGAAREVDLETEHPAWVDRAVLYGVVPFFFGDDGFRAVADRLDEIAALGATVVWLSPVTASAEDDFGYAVTDYFRLRASFGSEAEFRALVARAHALGLRVIMDFVPNHVSEQHPYFQHAQRYGPRSPYYDWFERDADGEATSYFDWEHLKNLDFDHPEVRNFVIAAFAYWVREFGIDGFRVDVGWGPRQRAPEFWERWRAELKRIDPDLFLLAEASARDPYYVRSGFDAAYDWTAELGQWAWQDVFRADGTVDLGRLRAALTNDGRGYPDDALILRFLNNNDTGERFAARHGVPLTRVAAALLFTLPGIPLIYTGDEIGAAYEPYDEGPPLDWRDRHGLLPYYTRLAHLRQELPALWSRELELLETDRDRRVLAYLRPGETAAEDVLVVLNFGSAPAAVRFTDPAAIPSGRLRDLLGGGTVTLKPGSPTLQLPAYGAVVLRR